jgi:hypothetical protein
VDVRSKEYVIDVLWDCILDQACWRHVDGEYLFQISHSALTQRSQRPSEETNRTCQCPFHHGEQPEDLANRLDP